MDLKILDSWLKDYLNTKAKPEKIAECLSLCGPSFERLHKIKKDVVYDVEITTNRVDSASHFGIAREAAAILPRFKIKASLQPIKVRSTQEIVNRVKWLDVQIDHKLCSRFTCILVRDVKIKDSPQKIKDRLMAVGLRAINNIVDISNYLMLDLGQPVHTFDYDKINRQKMILRSAKKGEKIITLDGQIQQLPGGDIVIEDGTGKLIDLCGIMGAKNSAIDGSTKNVLLFVQTYNPTYIRKTSMSLGKRSDAASLFEKGIDPELVEVTIRKGIEMFIGLTQGKPEKEILDLYPNPYLDKYVNLSLSFVNDRLGVKLAKKEVTESLESLGFKVSWKQDDLVVSIPSWRAKDVTIPEDIVEEIARIYGYHNLSSSLMTGIIPDPLPNAPFEFENKVKNILKGWGGNEVYTLSMAAKDKVALSGDASWVLKLKNPLGSDGEYMRLSLAPSLVDAVKANSHEKNPFFLFEIANIYPPVRGELPDEQMVLGAIFSGFNWTETRGIIDGLLEQLGIEYTTRVGDAKEFESQHRLEFLSHKEHLGVFGKLEQNSLFYFEFDMKTLQKISLPVSIFTPIPKYPSQIEDLNLSWPSRTLIGNIVEEIKKTDHQVVFVEMIDEYENSKTFRIFYQNKEKTLTDKDVELIRKKILEKLDKKFGVKLKN